MAPTCGVCNEQDSKYKCPICELRYCSIPCYKTHKPTHVDEKTSGNAKADGQEAQLPRDRQGTTQRAPKVDFTGFENDQDFQRLLSRFPRLKYQLQLCYGVTLEPGPDEDFTWARRDWLDDDRSSARGGFRGRGRGRGRGARGRGRGGRFVPELPQEERQRGPWRQEKGDKQALNIVHRMRSGSAEEELVEGMTEFIELCQIKFGGDR
ncbi:hypothetical protein DOTSEDRAFT_118716 [Dothistroma septosporum NZE10]|uniref:HIT-type domain-containing protein n=1 Tax=Dothistroma septosporum (strain NZE10 / CBS 128990) TaxID=675120 RepID=N1Q1M2_DOTSN|nr:hypothetical protein DOTSEDRAFT_118716 [Dothistroma septosporum NZE10]